jgi:hypothetical protein
LGSIIAAQLVLYSGATFVCGNRAFRQNSENLEICHRVLDQMSNAYNNAVKLLVALLAGQAMNNKGEGRQ